MISPKEIMWKALYTCPACDFPNFASDVELNNPRFKYIFCACGRSFEVEKPVLHFSAGGVPVSSNSISSKLLEDIKEIMTSQGYNKIQIQNAIELSNTKKIDSIQRLFTEVIPEI